MYRFFASNCHLLLLCPDLHFINNKNCLKAQPVQLVLTHNSKITSIVLYDYITALRAFWLMWPAALLLRCKFIRTKESFCTRKRFNAHRISLGHFIVFIQQYGRHDVMKKHQFIDLLYSLNIHDHTLSQDFMELLISREDGNGSETSQLKSIQYFVLMFLQLLFQCT